MRLVHLDNGHLSNMKYVITTMFIGKQGGVVFDPCNDVEVFDHYFSALRWMRFERNLACNCDYQVILDWNNDRDPHGREWILEMKENHGDTHTIVRLSRINENGFH